MPNDKLDKSASYRLGRNASKGDFLKLLEPEVGFFSRQFNTPRQILYELRERIAALAEGSFAIKIEEELKNAIKEINEYRQRDYKITNKNHRKNLDAVLAVLNNIVEIYGLNGLKSSIPEYSGSHVTSIKEIEKRISASQSQPYVPIEERLSFVRRDAKNDVQETVLAALRTCKAKMYKLANTADPFIEGILKPLEETVKNIAGQNPNSFGNGLNRPKDLSDLAEKVDVYLEKNQKAGKKFREAAADLLNTLEALDTTYSWTDTVSSHLVEQTIKARVEETSTSSSARQTKPTTHLVNTALNAASQKFESTDSEERKKSVSLSSRSLSIPDAEEVVVEPNKKVLKRREAFSLKSENSIQEDNGIRQPIHQPRGVKAGGN